MIFEFSTVAQPLVRAMDNLRLAESELKANHPDQAKAALAGASDALKSYEKLAGASRSKEVATLNTEIEDLAKDMAKNPVPQKPEVFSQLDFCHFCLLSSSMIV
ncbi:MAG: hypothetical protein ABSH20_12920 [Tepidisphaeraceae bacterium]